MTEPTCIGTLTTATATSIAYELGILSGCLVMSLIFGFTPFCEWLNRRKRLLSKTASLIKTNDGIVTVLDLVTDTGIPTKAVKKFLTEFAREMETEAEVEEGTGARFYRFADASSIRKRERS